MCRVCQLSILPVFGSRFSLPNFHQNACLNIPKIKVTLTLFFDSLNLTCLFLDKAEAKIGVSCCIFVDTERTKIVDLLKYYAFVYVHHKPVFLCFNSQSSMVIVPNV